jgi:hypothetical protein
MLSTGWRGGNRDDPICDVGRVDWFVLRAQGADVPDEGLGRADVAGVRVVAPVLLLPGILKGVLKGALEG